MKMYYTFKSKWGNYVTLEKEVTDVRHMNNFIGYLIDKKDYKIIDFGIIK